MSGVALRGDGYPNAQNTIALLRKSGEWDMRDQAQWLPSQTRLWHLAHGPLVRRLGLALRLAVGGFVQAVRALAAARAGDLVYLPYPAPMTLWWLALVPAKWRPACIADAYISLWDTMFRDRGGGDADGPASRLARWFEGRALRAATVVLVDTEANRLQMIEDFHLQPRRVRSIPLAIPEHLFQPPTETSRVDKRPLRVLFVGTLVPLHGIESVLAAATRLAGDPGIEFRLVGDGQQGSLVESFIRERAPANFTWGREWMGLEDIRREIADADICLGVFGGAGKAGRVLPFKLYYALASGKPIVTQSAYSLPEGVPAMPAALVELEGGAAASDEIASAIKALLHDDHRRGELGVAAREYFRSFLSARAVEEGWRRLVGTLIENKVIHG